MRTQLKLITKSASQFAPRLPTNLIYSELSLFVDLLLVEALSLGVDSLGVLSFSSFSAFFVLEESPEGDLWSVA